MRIPVGPPALPWEFPGVPRRQEDAVCWGPTVCSVCSKGVAVIAGDRYEKTQ